VGTNSKTLCAITLRVKAGRDVIGRSSPLQLAQSPPVKSHDAQSAIGDIFNQHGG
jgi:hypothetical protein